MSGVGKGITIQSGDAIVIIIVIRRFVATLELLVVMGVDEGGCGRGVAKVLLRMLVLT